MRIADITGLVLVPIALFVAAWVMNTVGIASSVLTATLPWICVMIGIVLLILGATCIMLQKPPAQLPFVAALLICIAASLGLLFGLFVDMHYHYQSADKGEVLMEWVGVTFILGIVFFVPRIRYTMRSGVCPQCKYDLQGDIEGGCPECGWRRPRGA